MPASVRIQNLLKQASANAQETATEDQASDHTHQNKQVQREPFELEVTEAAPTPDQLQSILEYVGAGKAPQLVKGAQDQSDALKKLKENGDNFQRPVVVDWNQGKAGKWLPDRRPCTADARSVLTLLVRQLSEPTSLRS